MQSHDFGTSGKPVWTSYVWVIVTYILSCTFSKVWRIIGKIFGVDRGRVRQVNARVRDKPESLNAWLRNKANIN